MKSKKVFQVLERKILKGLSYVNGELYKELCPKYLRKIGINIPEDIEKEKVVILIRVHILTEVITG